MKNIVNSIGVQVWSVDVVQRLGLSSDHASWVLGCKPYQPLYVERGLTTLAIRKVTWSLRYTNEYRALAE